MARITLPDLLTSFWKRRALTAAENRKRRHALEVPVGVSSLLTREKLGLWGSIRLLIYVVFGSPRQWSLLLWAFLIDRDTPKRRRRIDRMAEMLRVRLSAGCRVVRGHFERRLYSRDLARVPRALEKALHRTTPLLVVQPRTEADVKVLLAFATEHRVPIYPRGVSSSAFGGAVPTRNGIVVDLSVMREILAIDAQRRSVRLQPGVRWTDLTTALEHYGLVPITSPSSLFSTIGGWAATGGLGIDSFGHGPFSNALLSARVAYPSGRVRSVNGTALREMIGTEGQFGVFTELVLRVRPRPYFSSSRLLTFDSSDEAFRFIDDLVGAGLSPSHVAFFDRERLREENLVFADRCGRAGSMLEEREGVLLHFESVEDERAFLEFHAHHDIGTPAPPGHSAYLWAERFFPLHAQRLGPSMLASEIMLPRRAVPAFIRRAKRLARRFGRALAIEVSVSKTASPHDCVVIASFLCDARRRFRYLFDLLLVQLLTHLGVRQRGRPYGLGIWNSPFLSYRYNRAERERLVRRKLDVDPLRLLNTMKFFRLRTRLFNIPGLFFIGPVFTAALGLARLSSPILGLLARAAGGEKEHRWPVPKPQEGDGRALLQQSALRCTFCGACISSCPAYLLTRDEMVTGRAKLRLAETLLSGEEVQEHEAASSFLCLRCGLCEEVCQTRLPLRDCYLVLEGWLERRYQRPVERIAAFVQEAEKNRDWIQSTFGLDLPEWSVQR